MKEIDKIREQLKNETKALELACQMLSDLLPTTMCVSCLAEEDCEGSDICILNTKEKMVLYFREVKE